MRIKKTPPLQAQGRYILVAPWTLNAAKLYTCVAVRSFEDIYKLGHDVYETYYVSRGMTNGTIVEGEPFSFEDEKKAKVNIVTLLSSDNEVIYVPDTFIASFPDLSEVPYCHLVVSVDIGAVPDYLQLDYLKTQLSETVTQILGVADPTVKEHRIPLDTNPTRLEHDALEVARTGAITIAETDKAKLIRQQTQIDELLNQRTTLMAILQDHGLLPP